MAKSDELKEAAAAARKALDRIESAITLGKLPSDPAAAAAYSDALVRRFDALQEELDEIEKLIATS